MPYYEVSKLKDYKLKEGLKSLNFEHVLRLEVGAHFSVLGPVTSM